MVCGAEGISTPLEIGFLTGLIARSESEPVITSPAKKFCGASPLTCQLILISDIGILKAKIRINVTKLALISQNLINFNSLCILGKQKIPALAETLVVSLILT